MSTNFRDVPDCVWDLFREIMWASYNRERKPLCKNRTSAYMIAWGWDPPLMKHGSETDLTRHGLAYAAWREEQANEEKREPLPLNDTVYDREEDVPAAFREEEKPNGSLLYVKFLWFEYRLSGKDLSAAYEEKRVTTRVRVKGSQALIYAWPELLPLINAKARRRKKSE